jgi:hypothetical protein
MLTARETYLIETLEYIGRALEFSAHWAETMPAHLSQEIQTAVDEAENGDRLQPGRREIPAGEPLFYVWELRDDGTRDETTAAGPYCLADIGRMAKGGADLTNYEIELSPEV